VRDRRGCGIAATIMALVAGGEPVLVVTASAQRRARHLQGRLGGFALCSWDELQRSADRADEFAHVVALDPPILAAHERALARAASGRTAHLAWGSPELRFTEDVLAHDIVSRQALGALYAALRDAPGAPLEQVLRGPSAAERTAVHAGRLLRVLVELRLVELDVATGAWHLPASEHTELERSAAYLFYGDRLQEARTWLSRASARAA
jgi:single-stranded-DNA-specific exonuclease